MGDLDGFLADCETALGAAQVVTDPEVTAAHTTDWTGRWRTSTPAVLRPGSPEEVQRVVAAARRHRVALVPQGGNTGLVGGSIPHLGEVVVDLRRLDQLGVVDEAAGQVTAGAGVTLASLHGHVAGTGWAFGVDLAARDSATLGGMVATNAGGVHVLRHGAMRHQVLGVEAVLGTGERVDVNPRGLLKDNTGYDLAGLLCGSEGTLGIVTSARLRLVPAPAGRLVALLGFGSVAAASRAVAVLRALADLSAVEVVLGDGLEVVAAFLGSRPPLDPTPPCVLLVELAGAGDLLDQLRRELDRLGPALRGSAVADDGPGCARLWRWRDAHSEAAALLGLVHKADVTVPLTATDQFIGESRRAVDAVCPGATTLVFGHLGDGNLHVNVIGPPPDDDAAIDAVLACVLAHGGSVSAEHGVGVAKRHWLERQRGSASVAAMRAIKAALDPGGVLNPGVLLP